MPTLKQIELAKRVVENRGQKSMQELMLESGYTPATARAHAKQIQKGLGFIEILDKAGISNRVIANRLKAGINAKNDERKPDFMMRHRYLETVLQAKGLLRESTPDISGSSLQDLMSGLNAMDLTVLIQYRQRLDDNVTS
jgi:predicted transcriptional regulator